MPKSSQQIQVFFSSEHLLYSCGSALPPIRGKNGFSAGGRGSVFNFAQNPVNFSLENIPLLQKLYREELVGQTFEASGCVRPRRLLDKWSSGGRELFLDGSHQHLLFLLYLRRSNSLQTILRCATISKRALRPP